MQNVNRKIKFILRKCEIKKQDRINEWMFWQLRAGINIAISYYDGQNGCYDGAECTSLKHI